MIDASTSDLWRDDSYTLAITNGGVFSRDELQSYWLNLIRDYGLRFLEDPFCEHDLYSWRALTAAQDECAIIGDNLYCSEATRIEAGSARR